jgi:hypothetical protein
MARKNVVEFPEFARPTLRKRKKKKRGEKGDFDANFKPELY